ncbi:MAG: ATP-binding protein [Beijerinckiaceae bacterium]
MRRFLRFGLAERVLVLTVAFVMLAEIAIYVPSIANFRNNWLRDKLSAAYTAALVLEVAPDSAIPASLKRDLLNHVGAYTIALKMGDSRRLLAISDMPPAVVERFDLRSASPWESISAAFRTLAASGDRVLGVRGNAPMGGEFVEITLHEQPLRMAMYVYSRNILLLSLVISLIVAGLAMAAIHLMVLRPVHRFTSNLMAFADDPEDASRIIEPSGKQTEIGRAEEALSDMQKALANELAQKKHLAALGLAVAKINHDLRNMLASAQLLSDRLVEAPDPLSRRIAPRLIATLDRAIAFCQSTLTYGRAVERTPQRKKTDLHALAAEAAELVSPAGGGRPVIANNVPKGFEFSADSEQILRVFVNLFRNAVEALENAGPQPGKPSEVRISAVRTAASNGKSGNGISGNGAAAGGNDNGNGGNGGAVTILVSDTGPGVPDHARKGMFQAFQGSTRAGGSGLGLAIAAELVRAHGGQIELVEPEDGASTTFRIVLPGA